MSPTLTNALSLTTGSRMGMKQAQVCVLLAKFVNQPYMINYRPGSAYLCGESKNVLLLFMLM